MKKIYVTPITPISVFKENMIDRNVLINYLRYENYTIASQICKDIYVDNGAYTFWRSGIVPNYDKYYKWLEKRKYSYFFPPDIIDGTEYDNDLLIKQIPIEFKNKAIPVYHLHESVNRLEFFLENWNYIAIGASGIYSVIGSKEYYKRMFQIMKVLCNFDGTPKLKIHHLRCMNPKIFTKFPLYSGDSSNVAQNHHIKGIKNMLNYIESFNSPLFFDFESYEKFYFLKYRELISK